MSYRANSSASKAAVEARRQRYIAEKRCFTFGCWPGAAAYIVTRADGVEVPKCAAHARRYPKAPKRPIAEAVSA